MAAAAEAVRDGGGSFAGGIYAMAAFALHLGVVNTSRIYGLFGVKSFTLAVRLLRRAVIDLMAEVAISVRDKVSHISILHVLMGPIALCKRRGIGPRSEPAWYILLAVAPGAAPPV